MYANGADGLYLFNTAYVRGIREFVAAGGVAKKNLSTTARRHPVSFFDYDSAAHNLGAARSDTREQLPVAADRNAAVKIEVGKKPVSGRAFLILGALDKNAAQIFAPALNGTSPLSENIFEPKKRLGVSKFAAKYEFPPEAIKSGKNLLKVSFKTSEDENSAAPLVVWAEIENRAGRRKISWLP